MDKVRIDKWLWAVRIFKSRTMAGEVVRQGKVRLAGKVIKPSANVAVGDTVTVTKNGFQLQFEVLQVIDKRVGAPIAITCYADRTPAEELTKYKDWFVGKTQGEFRDRGAGRPTKRDRREIDTFKDDDFSFEFEDED